MLYVFGGVIYIFSLVFAVYLLTHCSSLRVSFNMSALGSQFLTEVSEMMMLPVIIFFFLFVWYLFWIVTMIEMASIGEYRYVPVGVHKIDLSSGTIFAIVINTFALFWVQQFLINMNQFIVCIAASEWYFNRKKKSSGEDEEENDKITNFSFRTAFKYLITKHLGSMAMSSFLDMGMWLIKFFMRPFIKKTSDVDNEESADMVRCCACCINCT